MQSKAKHVVVLGTGGTIAGKSPDPANEARYESAAIGVDALVAAIPGLADVPLQVEQVAQIDSKDMSFAVWRDLAARVVHHLADAEVAGIVITHGTDTLEETAYFLQRLLAPAKPVVLTAAMRPATALMPDGPQNLLDAVTVANSSGARGVLVAMAGSVFAGAEARKSHTYKLDTFGAGDHGPVAVMRTGRIRQWRDWPDGAAIGFDALPRDDDEWPWVEIVTNTAGESGAAVRALVRAGVKGIVAAGTGNGTLHVDLQAALTQARSQGVKVLRCSRCAAGGVSDAAFGVSPAHSSSSTNEGDDEMFPSTGDITPAQARVELMLQLMLEPIPEPDASPLSKSE